MYFLIRCNFINFKSLDQMLPTLIFFNYYHITISPKQQSSVIVIIRLMLSVSVCPKVITLGGFHCILKLIYFWKKLVWWLRPKILRPNLPKLLRQTHFSGMKDIKANYFLMTTDINCDLLKLENKAKNIDKY